MLTETNVPGRKNNVTHVMMRMCEASSMVFWEILAVNSVISAMLPVDIATAMLC